MNRSRSAATSAADEEAAFVELTSVLPAGDRLRFAALSRVALFSVAKQKSLVRQEKALVTRLGPTAPAVAHTRARLEREQRFDIAVTVEMQRTQATTVTRNAEALTLHGRVVNPQRLAVPGLTVSATDSTGKSATFTATDDNGYYSLSVPASAETTDESVTLLVSDRKKAVYFRGTECFPRAPGRIYYRELVTGTTDPTQPPTPPPDIDPESITVPDVKGLRKDVANAQLRAVGLAVESSTRVAGIADVGNVIEQNPKPGTRVAPCSSVAIVVGAPPPTVNVPSVIGRTVEAARATLEEAKLALGKITPAGASSQALVAQQAPAAGTPALPATPVDVVVREPVPTTVVPQLIESHLPDARKAIKAAGLTVGTINPPEPPKKAVVVAQAPAAGVRVNEGTTVHLTLHDPDAILSTVPSVLRLDLAAARLALDKAGLKLGQTHPADAPKKSTVVRQSPVAGTGVPAGSPVDVELERPAPIVTGRGSRVAEIITPKSSKEETIRKRPKAAKPTAPRKKDHKK